ncbi:MAG: thiamine phosphate synthase [Phycisphaeraceae bacterium]|nr:thiamine phosphate synthase [Phycisphaeraceae bacterium]
MSAEARIIDAAANRAREALRVMEDVARFGLDDAALAGELKAMRHGLRDAIGGLSGVGIGEADLLSSRDTPGDVGTSIEGAGEGSRRGLVDVAAAAGARLSEALRTLEEVSKTLADGDDGAARSWERFEALRYAGYDVQRRLALAMSPPARQWRLCVLVTEALCRQPWEVVVRDAIEAGADCLQLREKSLDSRELLARARRLVEIARPLGASVIINDRPDIALLSGADGVHLGQTDLTVGDVRRLSARLARRLIVGVSCSTLEQARAAVADGADYIGLGPMFVSGTKPKAVLAGPGLVERVVADPVASRVPRLAISGITPANIGELAAVGCRGVAVSAAVCGAADVGAAVRGLLG